MNLVFQAGDLTVGEGAFLMACCNHTDTKGYVIASMQQLADEAHMKMTAAKSNKQRLIKRGLLATAERTHPKTGARIADLYRVNLNLLASMKRARTDYGPTLVEELTFAAAQENPSSAPRSDSDSPPGRIPTGGESDSDGGGSDSDGAPRSDSDPLLPPSSDPSLSPQDRGPAEGGTKTGEGEREAAAPKNAEQAGVPGQRGGEAQAGSDHADRAVAAWVESRARSGHSTPTRQAQRQLRADATAALLDGEAPDTVIGAAADMGRHVTYVDLLKHLKHYRAPAPKRTRSSAERCPDHPKRFRRNCVECAMAVPA